MVVVVDFRMQINASGADCGRRLGAVNEPVRVFLMDIVVICVLTIVEAHGVMAVDQSPVGLVVRRVIRRLIDIVEDRVGLGNGTCIVNLFYPVSQLSAYGNGLLAPGFADLITDGPHDDGRIILGTVYHVLDIVFLPCLSFFRLGMCTWGIKETVEVVQIL